MNIASSQAQPFRVEIRDAEQISCDWLTCVCVWGVHSPGSCGCGRTGCLWESSPLGTLQGRIGPCREHPAGTQPYTALNINTDDKCVQAFVEWHTQPKAREFIPARTKTRDTHMMQTCPHHVELVYKLFVQGTHLWMHQLLVNGQPHSKDVHL